MPSVVLDWILSLVSLTRTCRSTFYKKPWKKNQKVNESVQVEPVQDDVQEVEKAACEKPDWKSDQEDEASFDVVTERKVAESLEDECTFSRITASGAPLVSPSSYKDNHLASISSSSSAALAACERKNLSGNTSPSSSEESALPLSFSQTSNMNEQRNLLASTSPSSCSGSALLYFGQTNTSGELKNLLSASRSPSSSAGSAEPLSFHETNTHEQKEDEMDEIIDAPILNPDGDLSSAHISLREWNTTKSLQTSSKTEDNPVLNPDVDLSSAPSLREWNATKSLQPSSKTEDNSINGVMEASTHETTVLSPIDIASPSPEELTNELKIEIEYMKSQLSIYDERFVGLNLKRELGAGDFGIVYEGETRFEKVAIKVLVAEKLATLSEYDYYLSMHEFYKEAWLHSDLNHQNILSFEFIISDVPPYGLPGIATEFMSCDLYHYIRKIGGLKRWNSVWSIAEQVANGLKYMHSRKIVHFDIKSSNILVEYNGRGAPNSIICKVADFGLAVKNYSGVMRINSRCGTTHYMAPEVLRASPSNMEFVSEKVDVYSYGILLWELILGVLPYNGMTDEQIGAYVLKGSRPPIPDWCDTGWRALMEDCWRQDHTLRPNFDLIVERLCRLIGAP